jgi:hypothetical protein
MGIEDYGSVRSTVSPTQRRKAFLHHAREKGFEDGESGQVTGERFADDPEARTQYLTGARIGRRERERFPA